MVDDRLSIAGINGNLLNFLGLGLKGKRINSFIQYPAWGGLEFFKVIAPDGEIGRGHTFQGFIEADNIH